MPTLHRINWIDSARGLCMTAILYDHTEIYYANDNIIPYEMYVINALTAFFFISGFLFWKEKPFQIKNKMTSIFRSLVIPYFIFTTAMAVHLPFYLHRTAITTNKVDTLYRKTQHGLLFLMWRHTATHRQNVQCGFAYLLFKPLIAFTCICLCACHLNHRNADNLQVRQNRLSGFSQTLSTRIIYLSFLYFK